MLFKNIISRARQREKKPCPFGRVNIPNAALKSSLFADARCAAPPSLFTYSLFPCLSHHSSETSLITTDSVCCCWWSGFLFLLLLHSRMFKRRRENLVYIIRNFGGFVFISPITTLPKVGRTWLLVHDAFECIPEEVIPSSQRSSKKLDLFCSPRTIWLDEIEFELF